MRSPILTALLAAMVAGCHVTIQSAPRTESPQNTPNVDRSDPAEPDSPPPQRRREKVPSEPEPVKPDDTPVDTPAPMDTVRTMPMDTLRMTWPDPPPSEPPPPEKFPDPPAADTVVEKATVPSNGDRLDIPPGHLPDEGECRIWIADTPAGRQARARTCNGAVSTAPAEAMVLEGLPDAKRHVRVFYIGARTGAVARVAVFEKQTGKFVRTETYTASRATDRVTPSQPVSTDPPVDEPNPRRQNPTGAERYTEPPSEPAAKEQPPQRQRTDPPGRQSDAVPPEPPVEEPPPQQPKTDPPGRQDSPPSASDGPVAADPISLDVARGQLPDAGECRIWMPDTPTGRQAKARSCPGILSEAPAGSMVLEGMTDSQHVRVSYIGSSAGTVSRVVIFERRTGDFAREELP